MGLKIVEGYDVVLTFPDDVLKFYCKEYHDLDTKFKFRNCVMDGEDVEYFLIYTNRLVGIMMNSVYKED